MKILMLLSKEIITDDRVYREAKALVEAGYKVTVISWDRHGEYEKTSNIDGINVFRVYNEGIMRILKNDMLRNPLWWKKAYKKALEIYKKGYKFDFVHCHDLDTLQIGVWLKKKLNTKLIYDAHDLFIAYAKSKNLPRMIIKLIENFEKKLLSNVDGIVTVNEALANFYENLYNKPIQIVMNCKELVTKRYIKPNNEIFTIFYAGILGRERFFPEIVDIVGNIDKVKLVIAGKKENIWKEVKKRSELYDNVEYIGTIPFKEVINLTLNADCIIAMVSPKNMGTKLATLNKQFEAMICGRPIITTRGTYAGELTEKLKCGLTVEYNAEAIKEAIIKLRDNPKLCEKLGKNALQAAIEKYNWENEKKKLLEMYKSMVDKFFNANNIRKR